MQPFTKLTSTPAPMKVVNVDTDMIIPKQFLKTIKRTGLGKSLFFEMRYDPEQRRVVYQPVTIEPREITPRIVREENYGDVENG